MNQITQLKTETDRPDKHRLSSWWQINFTVYFKILRKPAINLAPWCHISASHLLSDSFCSVCLIASNWSREQLPPLPCAAPRVNSQALAWRYLWRIQGWVWEIRKSLLGCLALWGFYGVFLGFFGFCWVCLVGWFFRFFFFWFFTSSAWTCIISWCKYLFLAPGWQSGKCKVALCTVLYRNSVGFAEGRYAQEWQSWAPLWVGANITSPVSGLFLHNVLKKITLGNSEKAVMCCCALTARAEWPLSGAEWAL